MSNTNPYQSTPAQTAIAIGYTNRALIADEVMPRFRVPKKAFRYTEFNKEDGFTLPETRVGRKGTPNQASFGGKERDSSCEDHGLDDVIPNDDRADNAASNKVDPVLRATEKLTALVHLGREVRVASKVQDPANYEYGQVVPAAQRFDAETSDPLAYIAEQLDDPIMRPNIGVIGQKAWTRLRLNPAVAKSVNGNDGDRAGLVSRRVIADLLELEDIFVGTGVVNIAKPGQPAQMVRVWGNNMAFHFRDKLADNDSGLTWGGTAQFGDWVAGTRPEPTVGLRGSTGVRVGESVGETVFAPGAGVLFREVIAAG